MIKYIFITGGVVSSLGKGITSASLASLLESRGLKVTLIKLDPYINVDPGTMSPFSMVKYLLQRMELKLIWILGHYERLFQPRCARLIILQLGKYMTALFVRNGAVIIRDYCSSYSAHYE